MWEQLMTKGGFEGGTLTDHDAPNEPTEIVRFYMDRREDGSEHVTVEGKDFTCSYDRRYCGIRAAHPGFSIHANFGMGCTISAKGEANAN